MLILDYTVARTIATEILDLNYVSNNWSKTLDTYVMVTLPQLNVRFLHNRNRSYFYTKVTSLHVRN